MHDEKFLSAFTNDPDWLFHWGFEHDPERGWCTFMTEWFYELNSYSIFMYEDLYYVVWVATNEPALERS